MVETVEVNNVKFVEDLYPRSGFDNAVVNRYCLNIENLPPILLTKEFFLVDGYHRLLAHQVKEKTEIQAEFIDIPKHRVLWEATKSNAQHGFQLKKIDKKRLAVHFYKNNGCTEREIADVLAVSEATLSDWLRKLRQQIQEEKKQKIIELDLQCKQQNEIAKDLGLTEGRVSQILRKFRTEEIKEIDLVPENLQFFNVWSFGKRDENYGFTMEGAIPGQIVENVLHYFTEPFDFVVDPMVGSGTTIDVCKAMYRRYRGYDLKSRGRADITIHDINEGFPKECKNCDLIFLDPPYYNMVFDCFSSLEEFYSFIENLAKNCFRTVKKKGNVTLLMQDMTEKGNHCLSGESYRLFREAGFKTIAHISCPLSTQQFLPQQLEVAKKERRILGRNRDLYVFRK